MKIYGKFENESATVKVTIYKTSDGTKVVDNAVTTHKSDGMYEYDFTSRDTTLDYRVVFNNTTDSTKSTGVLPKDVKLVDISSLATRADITALNDFNPATDTVARVTLVDTTTTNTDMVTSDEMTEAELHSALDSYKNKDDYKATVPTSDITAIKTKVNTLNNYDDASLKTLINGLNDISGSDVWSVASRTITNTEFGLSASTIDDIATEVESHLIDEADGKTIINAIVGAIGNTNLSEASLVSAIRADLERTNGNLNLIKTKTDTLANTDISTLATTSNMEAKLTTLNNNVKLASKLIPTNTDL
jgi:hypothetical protein